MEQESKGLFSLSYIAQIISIAVPLSILIGTSYKYGFYGSSEIDAIWIVSLFSPIDFMTANLEVMLYYSIAALYMAKVFGDKKHFNVEMLTQVFILIGLGIFFYLSIQMPPHIYFFIILSLIAFYLIIYKSVIGKLFGVLIILYIPFYSGENAIGQSGFKSLPHVVLGAKSDGLEWYLLDKYSDKAILINKSNNKNSFKIVELKDISRIENPPLKSPNKP